MNDVFFTKVFELAMHKYDSVKFSSKYLYYFVFKFENTPILKGLNPYFFLSLDPSYMKVYGIVKFDFIKVAVYHVQLS